MEAEDIRLFADSLRQAISRRGEDAVDEALTDVDWHTALAEDPRAATRVVFSLLGELNLASAALDDVLAFALGLAPAAGRAMILPALGSHLPPATYDRAELTIAGLASRRLDSATEVLVVVDGGKGHFLSRLPKDSLTSEAIDGIDAAAGWRRVQGTVKVSEIKAVSWDDVITAGQLALAQQLTSAARAMLALAREHALSRDQFDRPIASFQAVRHKLADSLVAIEGAQAALDAGWDDPSPFAAAMAKAIAGSASKTVAKHAQQVLAGMGFTSEHPFHHYMKRSLVLDQLLGSSATLRKQIGEDVITAKHVPPLLPL